MRASYISLVAFTSVVALLGLAMPAGAQVNVNLDALNPPAAGQSASPANRPARPAARPATRPRPASTAATPRRPGATPQAAPAPTATGGGGGTATAVGAAAAGAAAVGAGAAALALPAAAPATPVITPPAPPVPVVATPPVQRPATSASAGSATAATTEGLRITFATGKSDLTPESAASLTEFAKKVPPGEGVSLNVAAFAAGTPEDPSTARRLSLARALAIRSALMADGISQLKP